MVVGGKSKILPLFSTHKGNAMAKKMSKLKKLHKKEEKLHHAAERAMKKDEKVHEKIEKMEEKPKKSHKKDSKYSKKAENFISDRMRDAAQGEMHSGSKKGPIVKKRSQQIAIALSEAREKGMKVPKKKKK